MKLVSVCCLALVLAACTDSQSPRTWVGQWQGVEGTFLSISSAGQGYAIVIQDLDGRHVYHGDIKGGALSFERKGLTETIRPGTGIDTGMKWLSDKKNCLVIKTGEGYCRD